MKVKREYRGVVFEEGWRYTLLIRPDYRDWQVYVDYLRCHPAYRTQLGWSYQTPGGQVVYFHPNTARALNLPRPER